MTDGQHSKKATKEKTPTYLKVHFCKLELDDTTWHHLFNRCVRRAFLCGTNVASGQCYEHRRHRIQSGGPDLSENARSQMTNLRILLVPII